MTKLEKAALGIVPLTTATVESFYDGSRSGTAEQCLKALCESHERLRAELQGAEILLAESDQLDFASEALVALSGAGICTPERGYVADGGPSQMVADIKRLATERDAARTELEQTADKLSDCWLLLDRFARSDDLDPAAVRIYAKALLRKQQAPGWKDAPHGQ